MKSILLIVIGISLIHAAKLYDCGPANKAIQFTETISLYGLDSYQQLSFYATGSVLTAVQTDYVQIRVYGEAPEFKTFKQGRFSYSSGSYSEGSYFAISDYADFKNLDRATYKVQLDVFDANDNKVGCAAFYANQDQLEAQE